MSETFLFQSVNNRSEIFPYLCGFHSYISILVWKLFIPFGTVRTSEHFSIVPLKSCDLVWFGLGLSLPVLCGGRTSHHFSIGPL